VVWLLSFNSGEHAGELFLKGWLHFAMHLFVHLTKQGEWSAEQVGLVFFQPEQCFSLTKFQHKQCF